MKDRGDILLKALVTAAIVISLALTVLPERKTSVPSGSEQRSGARPSDGAPPSRENSQAVEAYRVSPVTVSNYIRVNGDMVTEGEIEIYPDTSGKIVSLNVSGGDKVTAGQILAEVDPSLPGQKFARSAVYSTISGTVLSLNAHRGDKVTANTSILTVGDLSRLRLLTYVPEKFTGFVREGLPAQVTFSPFGDRVFPASVSEVGSVISPESRTLEVTLKLAEEGGGIIKPGMFASIKLVTEQADDVLAVPTGAIFPYYGRDTVFVINGEGKAEHRSVTTGLRSSELTEITFGLAAGDVVVTAGQSLLKEGTPVHAVDREM